MNRILVVLLVSGLVLAPAALAKGPHAILSSGSRAVEANKPWEVTVEMMEARGAPRPMLLARRGGRMVAVRGNRVGSDGFRTLFRLEVVFPSEGRWRISLVDRKRQFALPAVVVGSGAVPRDYVAFPKGSMAARQGGGGFYDVPEDLPPGGESLPPETISLAGAPRVDRDDGDSGLWVLPLAGLVLAGAGAGVWRLRAR